MVHLSASPTELWSLPKSANLGEVVTTRLSTVRRESSVGDFISTRRTMRGHWMEFSSKGYILSGSPRSIHRP